MNMFSLLIAPFLVAVLSANERNATAMEPEFSLEEVSKRWTEMSNYFSTPTKIEPIVPFLIERNWILNEKGRVRRQRAAKTTAPPKTRLKQVQSPKLVFVIDATRNVRFAQYVYVTFASITSVGLLVLSIFGTLKAGTVVSVSNLYDDNKPQRLLPATLILFLRAKKRPRTPIETTPPEKVKTDKSKE